jgi:hypothetical protein
MNDQSRDRPGPWPRVDNDRTEAPVGSKLARLLAWSSRVLLVAAFVTLAIAAFYVHRSPELLDRWGHDFLTAFLILGVWAELWRKRIEESELGKQRNRIADQKVALLEKQLQAEAAAHERRLGFVTQELTTIGSIAAKIGLEVSSRLIDDPSWAALALEKAKIRHGSRSLFTVRSEHFREEKRLLAERFLPLLLNRIRFHLPKQVVLLIDSGTTTYPLMEALAKEAVCALRDGDPWLENLQVWTNNLPGVMALMDLGRINPDNPYSDLAFKANLLPGVPVPAFAAVAGKLTEEALRRVKSEARADVVFISLLTGNWVRVRETPPRCPVPLARGFGHLAFKQTLVNCSDEVFVLAPLGKVFADSSDRRKDNIDEAVNADLELREGGERDPYCEVEISPAKGGCVKLISTTRREGRLLCRHSLTVVDRLQPRVDGSPSSVATLRGIGEQYRNRPISELHSVLFDFDALPVDPYLQREAEFPHGYTRNADFMRRYFQVT